MASRDYSDAELIGHLKAAHGGAAEPLTTKRYLAYAAEVEHAPSVGTFQHRFGGWRAALRAAGLMRPKRGVPFTTLTVDDDAAAVRLAARRLGHVPAARQYAEIASSSGVLPSLAAVRIACGSWAEAVRLAGPAAKRERRDGRNPTQLDRSPSLLAQSLAQGEEEDHSGLNCPVRMPSETGNSRQNQ